LTERVILARHGESEVSVRTLMNGDPSRPVALTPAGREQALRLGEELAGEGIDLCVTSEFPRVIETAELALGGRDVPRAVISDLGDPRYGQYEGKSLEEYRGWASTASPREPAPGGGESRVEIARRYVRGFREVLARPEPTVLLVGHSLPIAYVVHGVSRVVPLVAYAHPFRLDRAALETAVDALERWTEEPGW
jgi:probable phosphoglycerate mutase